MKKIPTLFEREFHDHKVVAVKPVVTPGLEWVLNGEGIATVKYDGSCCAILNGKFYKRYDAKKGKQSPAGAIPCQPDPDPITGHWPHWIEVKIDDPANKWYISALDYSLEMDCFDVLENATYEAIGKHFQGNPYKMGIDFLVKHGDHIIKDCPRSYDGILGYLRKSHIEGIVFWKDGEPRCKIKRSDFGFPWPIDNAI